MNLTFNEVFALSCLLPYKGSDFDVRGFASPSSVVQHIKRYWLPFELPVGESTILQLFRTTLLSKNLIMAHGSSRNRVYAITKEGQEALLRELTEMINNPVNLTDILVTTFYINRVKGELDSLPSDIINLRKIAVESDFLLNHKFNNQHLVYEMLMKLRASL